MTLPDPRQIIALAEAATPGPWYTAGPPWFTVASGVLAGSPDPHAGFLIVDTEAWEGDRDEYVENNPNGVKLADPDADARYIAAMHPAAGKAMAERIIELEATLNDLGFMASIFRDEYIQSLDNDDGAFVSPENGRALDDAISRAREALATNPNSAKETT